MHTYLFCSSAEHAAGQVTASGLEYLELVTQWGHHGCSVSTTVGTVMWGNQERFLPGEGLGLNLVWKMRTEGQEGRGLPGRGNTEGDEGLRVKGILVNLESMEKCSE